MAIDSNKEYLKAYKKKAATSQNIGNHEDAVRDLETVFKMEQTRENQGAVREAKKQQKMAERKDYYKILKVTKEADEKEIKKAYKKKAMLHHPDRHSGATDEKKEAEEKLFKDVNEAFSVLSDETKKSRYRRLNDNFILLTFR